MWPLPRRYFGAAKQLPGVRELFEREPPRQIRRTRHQMYAHINADYYGFRDEEDGVLERVEATAEREIRNKVRVCRARVPVPCAELLLLLISYGSPNGFAVKACSRV